jgi:hypothetical protein
MSHAVPPTKAVVPAGLVQYKEDVQWWLESPENVEENFKVKGFPRVSPEYLHELEGGFRHILEVAINANQSKDSLCFNVQNPVLKFNGVMDASPKSRGFSLKIMIMRPCCMGQGFARLMLYWMARVCYSFGMDMQIRSPSTYTWALIEKAFGAVTDLSLDYDHIRLPHSCLAGASHYLGINPEWFIKHDNDADVDLVPTPPRLNVGTPEKPSPFPDAGDLSSGRAYARVHRA